MHASIEHKNVLKSSNIIRLPREVLSTCCLAKLIEDSHNPPKLGLYGMMKCDVICKLKNNFGW